MKDLARDLAKSYKSLRCIQRSPHLENKPFNADTLNQMALNVNEIVSKSDLTALTALLAIERVKFQSGFKTIPPPPLFPFHVFS